MLWYGRRKVVAHGCWKRIFQSIQAFTRGLPANASSDILFRNLSFDAATISLIGFQPSLIYTIVFADEYGI